MFKLPLCPYCKTVYNYKEVKENKKRIIKCYNCKRNFKRSIKGYLLLFSLVIFITILINVAILKASSAINEGLIIVSILSIIAVLICLLLLPFFVSYKINDK